MTSGSDLVMELIDALETLRKSHWKPDVGLPVTPSEMSLLMALYRCGGPTGLQPSELGEVLKIARPTVTALVNSLEAKGLVTRRQGEEDRRVVLVELTAAGLDHVKMGRRLFEEHMSQLVDFLGADDAQALIRLIHRVQQFNEMRKRECGN